MRKLFSLAMAFVLLAAAVSFSSVNVRAQDKKLTIAEIAAGNKDLTTLVAALKATGLDTVLADPTVGPYTVFAPTNAAFEAAFKALGTTPEKLLADPVMTGGILLYHVVPGAIKSDVVLSLNGAKVATALWNETLSITVADKKVKVNASNVTAVDIEASNGVIHVVDAVLVPKDATGNFKLLADASTTFNKVEKDIIGVASAADGEKTLVAAVSASKDVVAYLTTKNNSFTVFAPSDTAFANAFKILKIEPATLLADTKTLNTVLAYHVLPWPYPASVLAKYDGVIIGTSLPNTAVLITVKDGKVLVNGATVTTADVNAKNGVIHVIDDVLIPPSLMSMVNSAMGTPAMAATMAATATK